MRNISRTRSRPVTSSETGCSTCRRVLTSRKEMVPSWPTRNSHVPGADVPGLAQDRLGRVVEGRRPARRSGTARAPPRPASGGGAAASSRGWRPPRRCRAGRPGTGSRRGAACRGSARRSTRRGRTPRRPRGPRTRTCSATSPISRATFRPRPPPPNAALIAIGRPCSSANATTSSAFSTGSWVPATSGAPTFSAMWRALTLSPRFSMASGGGPIQVSPASMTAWAKSRFSARKP